MPLCHKDLQIYLKMNGADQETIKHNVFREEFFFEMKMLSYLFSFRLSMFLDNVQSFLWFTEINYQNNVLHITLRAFFSINANLTLGLDKKCHTDYVISGKLYQ